MRLVDADALMKTLGITDMDCGKCKWGDHGYCTRGSDFNDACFAIENAPTIEERKTGHWITKSTNGEMFDCCSVCGYVEWDEPKNYCPNCGADMRGGNHE